MPPQSLSYSFQSYSTYSSSKFGAFDLYASSTETLARRYKHLFKLPSLEALAIFYIMTSTALVTLAVKAGNLPTTTGVLAVVAGLLALFIVVSTIRFSDKNSIISVRRTFGLFLFSSLIWLFIFTIGTLDSVLTNQPSPKFNSFLFGGFLAMSFELVVINGLFMRRTSQSLGLAAIHPMSLFGIILPRFGATLPDYIIPCSTGLVMVLTAVVFLRKLGKFRNKHGITSLQLLQAFMKTWVAKHPSELETYFEMYSKNETVHTKIFRFLSQDKKIALILPGLHPGPFFPVGSYNLSEKIFETLNEDAIPMVLHSTGGHERNLPKNEYTNLYATRLGEFVKSLTADQSEGFKGPLRRKFGNTTITSLALGNQILAIVSRAPFNSDDLDPEIIKDATAAALERNLDLALVDAHNSIGGQDASSERIRKEDWIALLDGLVSSKEQNLMVGYAHSSEISFKHGSDISDAGIGVLFLETDTFKGVLIAADSNNARVGLRQKLDDQLREEGMELIELCTSDTHNLAARSLVSRGYFALGESTPVEQIIQAIMELVHNAQKRLARCKYTTADFSIDMPLIGVESLNDFASVTDKAIEFTKSYFKKIIPLIFVLLGITLFY